MLFSLLRVVVNGGVCIVVDTVYASCMYVYVVNHRVLYKMVDAGEVAKYRDGKESVLN